MRVQSCPREVSAFGVPCRAAGFTLVELMVTIAVAAILLMIAVPNFRNIISSNRLTTVANTMVNALNTARMEAIKRNGSVQFCSDSATSNTSDTLGGGCGTSGGAVWELTGSSAAQVLAPTQGLGTPVQLSGGITAIRFNGQGIGYAAGTSSSTGAPYDGTVAVVCVAGMSGNNRIEIHMNTGTIITTNPGTGSCP